MSPEEETHHFEFDPSQKTMSYSTVKHLVPEREKKKRMSKKDDLELQSVVSIVFCTSTPLSMTLYYRIAQLSAHWDSQTRTLEAGALKAKATHALHQR